MTEKLPDQQIRLRSAIESAFGDQVTELPSLAWVEFGLNYSIPREGMFAVFERLKNDDAFQFNMLVDVTCIDWMDRKEPRFEVVYHLLSITHNHRVCFRVGADEDEPEVDSVRPLWPAANFLEREVWDMYGVSFANHGDQRRILMYDEFVGHPLRKDYPKHAKQPRIELRVPELRNTSADMQREQLVSLPVRQGPKRSRE